MNHAAALARSEELVTQYGRVREPVCTSYLGDLVRRAAGASAAGLEIVILDTDAPLALSPGAAKILISKGLIKLFSNEAEMVFMLTHEVGHYALAHHDLMTELDGEEVFGARRDLELAADRFAVTAMVHSGYDPTYSVQALNDVYRRIKLTSPDSEYPSLQERITNLATTLLTENRFGPGLTDRRVFHECKSRLR